MTLHDHLTHGAHHMPLSAHLLRLTTVVTALTVAFATDATWLTILASTGAAAIALAIGLELHEAAQTCNSSYRDKDEDTETGFGPAA